MRIYSNASPETLAQGMIDEPGEAAKMLRAYADVSTKANRANLLAWLSRTSGKEARANLRRLGELLIEGAS